MNGAPRVLSIVAAAAACAPPVPPLHHELPGDVTWMKCILPVTSAQEEYSSYTFPTHKIILPVTSAQEEYPLPRLLPDLSRLFEAGALISSFDTSSFF